VVFFPFLLVLDSRFFGLFLAPFLEEEILDYPARGPSIEFLQQTETKKTMNTAKGRENMQGVKLFFLLLWV